MSGSRKRDRDKQVSDDTYEDLESSLIKGGAFGKQEGRERDFNLVVFGPTGSGKTTLINWLCAANMREIIDHKYGFAGVDALSKTRTVTVVKSDRFLDEKWGRYAFNFFDTPGHGAADNASLLKQDESTTLMESTIRKLMEHTQTLNGVILVLKMERYRQDLEAEMVNYLTMFKTFKLRPEAFLIVITHSLMYKKHHQEDYSKWIVDRFGANGVAVKKENIVHVNFVLLEEIEPSFAKLYASVAGEQQAKFKDIINSRYANEYNIRHWFDKEMGLDQKIADLFSNEQIRNLEDEEDQTPQADDMNTWESRELRSFLERNGWPEKEIPNEKSELIQVCIALATSRKEPRRPSVHAPSHGASSQAGPAPGRAQTQAANARAATLPQAQAANARSATLPQAQATNARAAIVPGLSRVFEMFGGRQ